MIDTASKAGATAGRVERLFLKSRRGAPMVELGPGELLACAGGLGISGDVHAHRLSPRQILVTLQAELDALALAPGALHENMVVSMDDARHFRPGAAIVAGGGVEIRLTMHCEPCKRILPLVADLAGMIGRRGILGHIVAGGALRVGEAIGVIPGSYPALPDSPADKFRDAVQAIPAGRVLRYLDVTIAMGVDASFARAVPGYMKRHLERHLGTPLPVHRIVDARGRPCHFMPGQAAKLASEGIGIDGAGAVDLQTFLWDGCRD